MPSFHEIYKKSELVRKAYDFAKKAHQGQKRKNGEPFFNHPLAAAESIAQWGLDDQTVAAALLHDVVEDTPHPLDEIEREFGKDVAFLVDGVTKVGKVRYRGVESRVENLRKFVLYLSKDIRVILIKLADRMHNMMTLYSLIPAKQKRIALETMEIYAPIAYRLGMQKLSGEMEDLAFPYIYPQEHKWLVQTVKDRYEEREKYAEKLRPILKEVIEKNGIKIIRIDSRAKRHTSLYKKLLRYDMDVERIHDLVATRVIVPTIEDCYAALGLIHNMWPPLPGRIKDYIALPKPNGYKSIHTTVFGPDNRYTEIQIRTPQMHEEAELGIAAHFAYQQTKGTKAYAERQATFADKKELSWINQLRNWQKDFTDPEEFMKALKIEFFRDRILALSPKGEVFDLPSGATPVDFAYNVHTEVGNQCSGALVNGKIVPLDYELKSGDIVEIITQKNKRPSEDWLKFVKTNVSRSHIKSALKKPSTTGGITLIQPYNKTELKLTTGDRLGLIKDISTVITGAHINILGINTQRNGEFTLIKIQCPIITKEKTEKLLVKLKKIKEVKEASFQLV